MKRTAIVILVLILSSCGGKSDQTGVSAGERAMAAKAVADVDAAAAEARPAAIGRPAAGTNAAP